MAKNPKIFALVLAGGNGLRAGGERPKQYQAVGGMPLLAYGVKAFLTHPAIAGVQVVIGAGHEAWYRQTLAQLPSGAQLLEPVLGGSERQYSVRAGLTALAAHAPDYVLIHDAARPFVSHGIINAILEKLDDKTGVAPALPMADTVRRLHHDAWEDVPREGLLRIQTPQAFPYATLAEIEHEDIAMFTDDAGLWLAMQRPLVYVTGDERLRKVTSSDDVIWAEGEAVRAWRTVVATGYDVHRFTAGDHVMLGGVSVPHTHGLEGHSDADVVLHALVDAVLGALAEGDIGQHFPPSDPRYKGADSAQFVQAARARVEARGGRIEHVDITVVAETPKLAPHRDAIRHSIASLIAVELSAVAVKATTTEGLGFTGRAEGVAAMATVTLCLPR